MSYVMLKLKSLTFIILTHKPISYQINSEQKQKDQPNFLYSYDEPDGSTKNMWCQGVVVAVRTRNRIHIEWDTSTLRDDDQPITEETLMKSKYNKHVIGGWRYSIE